jgi:hypothetical protein
MATSFTTPQDVLAPAGYVWTGLESDAGGESVYATAAPVPEPGTLGLIAAAGLPGVLLRRRAARRPCGSFPAPGSQRAVAGDNG